MSLSFSYPVLAILLGVLVAGLFTFWSYTKSHPKPRGMWKWILIGLRSVSLGLIVALLAEPLLRSIFSENVNPVVSVLIDESQSMQVVSDSSFSRSETVELIQAQLAELGQDVEVQFHSFGSKLENIDLESVRADSGSTNSNRTDISLALEEIRRTNRDENLQGVILVSDGHYNSGSNPIYLAEKYPVPIHTVAVGDSVTRKDVKVSSISTNNIAYIGRELPVRVQIMSDGYSNQNATLTLRNDDGIIDETSVKLPADQSELSVDLLFVPSTEGSQSIRASISRFDGEVTYRNNSVSTGIQVLNRKRKVLLIGGSPDPDLATLKGMLDDLEDIELKTLTQKSSGSFYEGSSNDVNFSEHDALILCGFPAMGTPRALLERVNAALAEGTPSLFVGTRNTNVAMADQVIGENIPVRLGNQRKGFVEIGLRQTEAGVNHAVLDIPNLPDNSFSLLPPLWASETLWRPSIDAQVLATRSIRGIELDDPVIVARSRNRVRSVALLASGMWRWKTIPEDLEPIRPFWPEFLSNSLQWITTGEDDRPVRVRPLRQRFTSDELVQFQGQVYDESLDPVNDASVELIIKSNSGETLEQGMQVVGNGRYFVDAGRLPKGNYSYIAKGSKNGQEIGQDQGSFTIGETAIEYRETSADLQTMRQVALKSGGNHMAVNDLSSLGNRLNTDNSLQTVIKEQDKEIELWRNYGFLAALIILLTLEWFLRKRQGMH